MQARRDKNLCYYCDEVYHRWHTCTKKQLYILIGEDNTKIKQVEDMETLNQLDTENNEDSHIDIVIPIHALLGNSSPHTIRLLGKVKKNSILILVDSGSTHYFLDLITIQKLSCVVAPQKWAVPFGCGQKCGFVGRF